MADTISLLRDNTPTELVVKLDDQECISGSTFRELSIDSAFTIFAVVHTRDRQDFRKKYRHFYYGPNLIRILFQKFDLPN